MVRRGVRRNPLPKDFSGRGQPNHRRDGAQIINVPLIEHGPSADADNCRRCLYDFSYDIRFHFAKADFAIAYENVSDRPARSFSHQCISVDALAAE